jgi:hypothetical protein
VFSLTITNDGKWTEHLPDFRKHPELGPAYFDLKVYKDGQPEHVPPVMVADPPALKAEDLLSLSPRESVTFKLSRFSHAWNRLPPGTYEVRVVDRGLFREPVIRRYPRTQFAVRD